MVASANLFHRLEAIMLMYQGIGLDRFNTMTRGRAVHALYECCCNVTWAAKIAEARPYPDRDVLLAMADVESLALSEADLDRAFHVAIDHQFVTKLDRAFDRNSAREKAGRLRRRG